MALRVPETFFTPVGMSRRMKVREQGGFVLPENHRQDLRDVAMGVEETNAGVCTRYLVDHSLSHGPERDEDGYAAHLHELERWCDRFSIFSHPSVKTWRNRILRCKRALARMCNLGAGHDVGVLHIAHGYPDPTTRNLSKKVADYFGELAPLARYTNAVEEQRKELVQREALVGLRSSGGVVDLVETFERKERADRILTSGDALRDALAPFREKSTHHKGGELKVAQGSAHEQHEARRAGHEARQAAFLVRVKEDAHKMLTRAEERYWGSWLVVA